jgi:hypothetical protein
MCFSISGLNFVCMYSIFSTARFMQMYVMSFEHECDLRSLKLYYKALVVHISQMLLLSSGSTSLYTGTIPWSERSPLKKYSRCA